MGIWKIDNKYNGLKFFAQLSEELLSYYSHDSFKVPTLNFHYLCLETLKTIEKIEDGVVDRGAIVPLMQEIIETFKTDPIVADFYGADINSVFSTKNKEGKYGKEFKDLMAAPTSDASIQRIKQRLQYLFDDLSRMNRYYLKGISQIEKLVLKENVSFDEIERIRQYTRVILTELINKGYSQEYIFNSVKDVFFNKLCPENHAQEAFYKFINCFSLTVREYTIYLPLNNPKLKEELSPFTSIKVENNIYEMFNGSCSFVIKIDLEEMDPESAKIAAIGLIDFCLSISQYCRHSKREYSFKYAEIVDKETTNVYKTKTISHPISRQKRTLLASEKLAHVCLSIGNAMFGAIGMHASAFKSKDTKNQLLNLWTAMELLIPVERAGSMSKINQIANQASTLLSSHYIKSLIEQLDKQCETLFGEMYEEVLKEVDTAETRCEKLLVVITVADYDAVFQKLLGMADTEPLCAFRLQHYKKVFSSGKSIRSFYERHSQRVSWQIMRIYRSRNLIVHDGSAFPFLEVVLQNLHFYIDSIIDIFCEKYEEGFNNPETIIALFSHKESAYLSKLNDFSELEVRNFAYATCGE